MNQRDHGDECDGKRCGCGDLPGKPALSQSAAREAMLFGAAWFLTTGDTLHHVPVDQVYVKAAPPSAFRTAGGIEITFDGATHWLSDDDAALLLGAMLGEMVSAPRVQPEERGRAG